MSTFKLFWTILIITWCVFSVQVPTLVAGSRHSECAGRAFGVTLDEGLTAGSILFRFKQDRNIVYVFHLDEFSQEALNIFQITPAGVVTNVVTLDHEDRRGNEFILTVLAKNYIVRKSSEQSSWVTACSLTITVRDLNDHFPQFHKDLYVGFMQENQPKGSIVRGLNGIYATDLDAGPNSVHSYKIISGNGVNKFEAFVEELNGRRFLNIRSKVKLDREKVSFYVLTVQATDGGTPARTGRTQIRINVLDLNDCSPKYTSSQYLVSVLPTVSISTEVLKVHAQDDDSDENSEIYYFFKKFQTKTIHDNYFTLDPHTGVVRVARDLALISGNVIRMTIVAQDRGNPPRSTETVVEVELLKEMTQSSDPSLPSLPPRLAKPAYLVRIREDLPMNAHILLPDVLNLSRSKFKTNFAIISQEEIPFQVDLNSGFLYLVKNLDFETKQRYELKLVLTSLEKSETNVTVLVDDADENYNAPIFKKENKATFFSVKKDMRSSHFLAKVKAFDPDEGLEGTLNYRICEGSGVGKFSIERKTGRIVSVPGLDWEGVQELGIFLEVRDSARRWRRAKQFLLVSVTDHLDCNPMFEKVTYEGNVSENLPPGVFVAVVKARLCHGQKIEYFITEGNSRNSFEIDKYSGIVRTRSSLDREEQAVYTLEITARNDTRSSKTLLVINIDDLNDHGPQFSRKHYQIEIPENRGKIESLLCLVAKDKDYGDNGKVKYSIVSGDESLFHIDQLSGTLSSESLNFEDTRVHVLRINATDHGTPSRSSFTTVEVLVRNLNDPPKFESSEITVNVDEEKPAGTRMVFLPVRDEDADKNGEFDCSYENIQPVEFGKFDVLTTASGCEIENKMLLKWFEGSSYSLRVRVTDKAPLLVRKSCVILVTIKINDLNNHDPMFLQDSYHSSVSSRTTSILTVTAIDEDNGRNAKIRYSLARNSNLFRIDSRTGKLTAVKGRLPVGKYDLDVYAEDHGSPKRRSKVKCLVIVASKINRSPLAITLSKSKPNLYENVALNTRVSTVRVNKARVQYLIVGGNIGNAFKISQRGRINVASTLDYERVREYTLAIRVVHKPREGLDLVAEKVLKITILDINDHEPRFTILPNSFILNMNINTKVHPGTAITRVLAYDADSSGTVTYTIKSSLNPVPFDINTISGEITARDSIQSRSWPYSFTVVAEDGGTPRKRSELEVNIRILRGRASLKIPGRQLITNIDEGRLRVGLDIINFSIKNKADHELTYSIVGGNYGNAFCVDVRGSLQAVRELDRESRASYVLSVSVNDGESSEISDVHISVNDLDDNRPQFPNEIHTIFTDENARAQKISTFSAEDKDAGNVTFGIVGTSRESYSSVFAVTDGILMITRILDHEQASKHVLTIVAEDQASHKTFSRAVVLVRDKNDNAPRFLSRDYAEYVHVSAPKGYFILRTLATDKDSGVNGLISYTIHPLSKMFTMDASTGWLRVASELTHGYFMFNVTAKDHGTPRLSDTVSVMLTVDVTSGSPRFSYVGYPRGFHASISENHPSGSTVMKLTAVSSDVVTYDIYRSNVIDFIIDPVSGEIRTTKSLDYENIKYYEFTVSATDRRERISLAHVNISVLNLNDNKPQILNKNKKNTISCNIRRDASTGSSLIQIHAQDLDEDRLHYSLTQNSKPILFSISTSGHIKTLGSLHDTKDYNIYLAVTVRDNGSPALEDTVTVNVVIVNYGYNIISMFAQVSENTEISTSIHVSPIITPRYTTTEYTLIYPPQSPFTIHNTLGDLSLERRLDYEERQNYSLIVRLQDASKKNDYFDVKIGIDVKDENDNDPVFITPGDMNSCKDPVSVKIHENAQKDSLVYHFKAEDKDSGLNGDLYYEMERCQDCTELFSLNQNTGELKTSGVSLIKPEYQVNVVVKDKGTPGKHTRACILVQAGYWKAKFTQQEYHFEMDESARIGQLIGSVRAHGYGVSVTYELRRPSIFFSVNPTSGIITLISALDYEKSAERKLEFNIIPMKQASSTRVIVHVRDVNDCPPTFDQSTYTDSVPESAPVGSTLLKLHASDGDSGLNADIRYSLDSELFIVDSYTGIVSTAVLLDYETQKSYTIPVIAHDRGSPSLVGKTKLTINIENVNDNWPVFTSQEYSRTILENAKPGSDLIQVRATDADGDEIRYDIIGGNDAGVFKIGSRSGLLHLIDDSSVVLVGPYYILNVSATDGVFWKHSVVRVNIEDVNDHAPVFTKCSDYTPSIPENSPLGTTVLHVSASDSDLGINGHVTYAIVQQSYGKNFGIDRRTGRIESRVIFDRESKKQAQKFSILVKATDGNNEMKPGERLEGSCSIDVTITDVNDNKPVFQGKSYTQKVNENIEIGHRVMKVRASDIDEGLNAKITYSLKKSSSLFSIDAETGVINTLTKLKDKMDQYMLKIVATDHGDPTLSTEVDVTINVFESNDEPEFTQSFYEVTIPEDFTKEGIVARVNASSRNPKFRVFYYIEHGSTPDTNSLRTFSIALRDGIVRVKKYLDRETVAEYTLTIRADINARRRLNSWTTLRIVLSDVNDCAPEFVGSPYDGKVSENVAAGATVLKVSATDDDEHSETIYSIPEKNEDFRIHKKTGLIQTKKMFDSDKRDSYHVVVRASDGENPDLSSETTVRITITDKNDQPPVFEQKYYEISVMENFEDVEKDIGKVKANDADLGENNITYVIKSGNIDGNFRIGTEDGRVFVNGKIDYEARTKYELVIGVWDGKHEDTTQMKIKIENVNDNDPTFEGQLYEAYIKENRGKGSFVTTVKATDPDANWIRYELLSSEKENNFLIKPNTNDIITNAVLDREEKDTYTFEVFAYDHDGKSGTAKVIVHVQDTNDNTPAFNRSSLKLSVREDEPWGSQVGKVIATDRDDVTSGNGKVSYGIVLDPSNAFTIEKDTGVLRTAVVLDRENKGTFTITVNASDHGNPSRSSHADVIITVLDKNDHSPRFSQKVYEETLAENSTIGAVILQLTATDNDIGENALFSFKMSTYTKQFEVDPRSGKVKLAAQLDYEKKSEYKFGVEVKDGGKPALSDNTTIIIKIRDVNDCSPIFSQTYNFKIDEGRTGVLGTLLAVDEDGTTENSELWYSIPDGAAAKVFVVDSDIGRLSVKTPLDYEAGTPKRTVKVRATNVAPPFLYGETEVVIEVEDINDNVPTLENKLPLEVAENSNVEGHRTEIKTLRASDKDSKPNGEPFTFKIISGNEKNLFQLDSKTGFLSTEANFDREEQAVYVLVVNVRDSGSPPLTNNVTVPIHVTDRNDNQHRAGYLELTVNMFEQQTISPTIGRVFVQDKDTDDLREYKVITDNIDTFTVDKLTGNIVMKRRPTPKEYKFQVLVSDRNSSFHPVKCEVKISVNILSSEAFSRSITLRFVGMSVAEFVRNLSMYRNEIAKALNVVPDNVDIFSIQGVPSKDKRVDQKKSLVDVRLAAHGSPYYAPERLISILKAKTVLLRNFQNVSIGYEACLAEPCESGGCKSLVRLTGEVIPVDSGDGQTFASAETSVHVKCESCEKLFPRKISCEQKPCLNSGVCKDIPGGYLCTCPRQYQGPNCELTTRSFKAGEWVWLRALKSCSTGTLSLEFSTLEEDGLLLYAGPTTSYVRTALNTPSDFIAIQLLGGKVRVKLSLGDRGISSLNVKSKKLNDGKWHLLEVYRNATFVRVVVDQCNSSLVKADGTEGRRTCEQTLNIKTKFRFLDINTPVHLGGILKSPPEYLNLGKIVYDGCIRNVREDGIMFDLKDISNSHGSQEGCPAFDQHCPLRSSNHPCARNGSCVASREGFSCVCPPGFGGTLCETVSLEQALNESSFITYRPHRSFLKTYNPKFTEIQMMIRTRDTDGGPLLMIRDKNKSRRLVLQLTSDKNRDFSLEGKINSGGKETVVTLTNTLLSDGQWHHVTLARYRNEIQLGIDPNNHPRTVKAQAPGPFIQLQLTPDSEIILGASAASDNGFDGCIKDVRLNGRSLPYINESNSVAVVKEYKDIKPGCHSAACDQPKCPENYFCYDKWRVSECLRRRCTDRPCLNQATCIDYVANDIAKYHCKCREGFNGSRCETGGAMIRPSARQEVINVKLVVGLSCFVVALALATLLIVCYHRHQTKGKATFDRALTLSKLNKNSSKKSLVAVDWSESNHEPNKTNNGVKNLPPSTHSVRAHIHNTTRPSLVPVKSHPLDAVQTKPLSQLPAWDIPPMIDIVLSPESDPSSINDDYIEDPDEISQDTESRYVSGSCRDRKATLPEQSPSRIEPDDTKEPTVSWNDIEEYGRKFYKLTRSFIARDDGRPESGISTTSNSSSVVTVVENPLA